MQSLTLSRGSTLCRRQQEIPSHLYHPYTAVFCTGSYGSVYAVCCRRLLWSSPTYGTGPGPVYMVTVCTPYTVTVTIPRSGWTCREPEEPLKSLESVLLVSDAIGISLLDIETPTLCQDMRAERAPRSHKLEPCQKYCRRCGLRGHEWRRNG